jgi:hypothetical protein
VVELGENTQGRTVTTCVAVPTSDQEQAAAQAQQKPVTLTARQTVMRDCLLAALNDHGRQPPPERDIPSGVRAVTMQEWVEATIRYAAGQFGKEAWRQRARATETAEQLQAKNIVKHVKGWCWLPKTHSTSCQTQEGISCQPPDTS